MINETIYFGRTTANGEVTLEQWQQFVDAEIVPGFNAGFTLWPATGYWREANRQTAQESSYVFNVIRENTPQADGTIRKIIAAYKQQFSQHAVLRHYMVTCASF